MTGSDKAYSAPRLETLNLRETRDIHIHIGLGGAGEADVHIGWGGLIS